MANRYHKLLGLALRNLGYVHYNHYLKSKRWRRIRSLVLKRDGYLCRMCGCKKVHAAHHIGYTYRALIGTNIDCIVSVCGGCHQKIHFFNDGSKRDLDEAIELSQIMIIYTPPGFDVNLDQSDIDLLNGRFKVPKWSVKNIKRHKKKIKAGKKRRDESLKNLKWAKAIKRMSEDAA